jgi:SAM-dependent methyltransferase
MRCGWPGMRVLDVGSGPGDVSFTAARLVGPTGSVLGVDAASEMVELARARAAEKGLSTVHFMRTAIDAIALDEPVDAVIGRLILMHLPDPAARLRQLSNWVRPGGVIAFSENDITETRSIPDLPLFGRVTAGIVRAFEAMGLSARFGTKLHTVFTDAGLGAPHLTLGAPIGTAADTDILSYAAEVWRLVSPIANQGGFAIDELADIDNFVPLFREEALAANALITMPPLITAWARVQK